VDSLLGSGACLDSVEKIKLFLSLVGLELLVSNCPALIPAKIVPGFFQLDELRAPHCRRKLGKSLVYIHHVERTVATLLSLSLSDTDGWRRFLLAIQGTTACWGIH
jgi:hypothetical protein